MKYSDFREIIMTGANGLVSEYGWRLGQSVFNLLDSEPYNKVGREVKENDDVDCFYDDKNVELFIECAYKYYKK